MAPKAPPLPSIAQAKRIARIWSELGTVGIMVRAGDGSAPYVDPTNAACIKRGWLTPQGEPGPGLYNKDDLYQAHAVSAAGLLALENFLMDTRLKGSA